MLINGPLPVNLSYKKCCQYKKLQTEIMFLSITSLGDKCCILNDGSICIILNIVDKENKIHLVIQKFVIVEDFYDIGISSSKINIFKCSALAGNICIITISDLKGKCYLMPYWKTMSGEDSSDSSYLSNLEQPVNGKYIVALLL